MDFDSFYTQRKVEKEWMSANGYNEGNPETNGEFKAFETCVPECDVFIDIGANNGIFLDRLNSMAKLQHRIAAIYVMAFEPNPNLADTLNSKLRTGRLVQAALSEKPGRAIFKIYSRDDTTSSLLERADMMPHFTDEVSELDVQVDALDSYLPEILDAGRRGVFIKMDVEGVEWPVLLGGEALFQRLPRAFLMFEYSKAWRLGNHSLKNAFHFLDRSGFRLFRVTPLGLEALRFYTPDMDGPDYCNYFAIKGFDPGALMMKKSIPSVTHNWNDFFVFPVVASGK